MYVTLIFNKQNCNVIVFIDDDDDEDILKI